MGVTTEKKDRVWTVIIDRPEARNTVNRQTADQLVEAFRQFDQEAHAAVAVLWGAGGTFCAGAAFPVDFIYHRIDGVDAVQANAAQTSAASLPFG